MYEPLTFRAENSICSNRTIGAHPRPLRSGLLLRVGRCGKSSVAQNSSSQFTDDRKRQAVASPGRGSAMFRRLSAFGVAAILGAAQFGCHSCGDRPGWFTSHRRASAPCQTVGRTGGCFDAATGQPVPCPPEVPVGPEMVPGAPGIPFPPPGMIPNGIPPMSELPMPAPSDRIQPPAVPVPAPGDAHLPFPTSPGVPVKSGQNK